MILELLITKNFSFLGKDYQKGDLIIPVLSKETLLVFDDIQNDDTLSDDEKDEKENKVEVTYSESRVEIIYRSPHMHEHVFCKEEYNLSVTDFMGFIQSICLGKVFPEDVETGYSLKERVTIPTDFTLVSNEVRDKIIKLLVSIDASGIEYSNKMFQEDPEANFFKQEILTEDGIINKTIQIHSDYKNSQFFESKLGDLIIIMQVESFSIKLENGFSGVDFFTDFHKTDSDYSFIHGYIQFRDKYINLQKKHKLTQN